MKFQTLIFLGKKGEKKNQNSIKFFGFTERDDN